MFSSSLYPNDLVAPSRTFSLSGRSRLARLAPFQLSSPFAQLQQRQRSVFAAAPIVLAPGASDSSKDAQPAKPWVKMVIGGVCTVLFEAFGGGNFFEFLKIAKQTTNDPYGTIIKRVTAEKGIAAALDGFLPWGCIQAVAKGAVFSYGQAASFKLLHGSSFLSDKHAEVLSGGMGGFVQGVVMSPILLLKTRVMTDPAFRSEPGVMATARASARVGGVIISREGPLALMKGSVVFSCKRFGDWTTRYLFVMLVEDAVRGDSPVPLSSSSKVFCALAGGTLSALATIPVDVLVATIQQASNAGSKVSILETFTSQGGVGNIIAFSTRGLVARVAHVALTTLLMKTVTAKVYDAMYR